MSQANVPGARRQMKDWREKGAKIALLETSLEEINGDYDYQHAAFNTLRNDTLEEAAKLADGWDFGGIIAKEIRALKEGEQ